MTLRTFLLPLFLALFASLAGLTFSAAYGDRWHSALSATLFAIIAIAAGFRVNAPLWRDTYDDAANATTPAIALMRTTQIAAMVYVWGGAAMYAIYHWSGLHWRHAWQYGLAMTAIAAAHIIYVWLLSQKTPLLSNQPALGRAVAFAALHGLAASCGLVWLVATGKLYTKHDDWAANHVFLAGALMLIFLSAFAVKSHRELENRQP